MLINLLISVINNLDTAEITTANLSQSNSYIFSSFFLICLFTAFIAGLSTKILLLQISRIFDFILEN